MIKYLLQENLIALDGFGIEPGYDHCIESWREMPKEEDITFWIKESINKYWKRKNVKSINFTLYKIDTNDEEKEWEILKEYSYDIDKARKNKFEIEYHNEFIELVEKAKFWSDIEPEDYISHLEDFDLDYYSYDDPDSMWKDYVKKMKELEVEIKKDI